MEEPKYEDVETVDGTITDARNGEIIPKGTPPVVGQASNILQLQINANVIGTLELSPETEKILDEKLDPKDVLIRPDGLVYLPWTWYAARLNRAFGRLKWGLIPQGSAQSKETGKNTVLVIWGNWLIIKGIPVGFAVGETSYQTNNFTMSYGDAIAGAQSISLARNCKVLGMSLELWDSAWVSAWKKQYAEQYEYNGKTLWRKRLQRPAQTAPTQVETENTVVSPPAEERTGNVDKDFPPLYTAKELKGDAAHVGRIAKESGKTVPEVMKYLKALVESSDTKKYLETQMAKMIKGENNG